MCNVHTIHYPLTERGMRQDPSMWNNETNRIEYLGVWKYRIEKESMVESIESNSLDDSPPRMREDRFIRAWNRNDENRLEIRYVWS